MITVKIILGSTREGRFGEKPARWIFEKAKGREGVVAELLDLREYPLPFFNEAILPLARKGEYPNEVAARWAEKIREADAVIIATPEYNHGYPAVLKNALDFIYDEWNRKPVAFVGWGSVGGARAVEQLRQVVVQLQMVAIQNAVHFSFRDALDEKGNFVTASFEEVGDRMLDQLLWWAKVLKSAREH